MIKIPLKLVSEANSNEHWTEKSRRHKIQKLLVKTYLKREVIPDAPWEVTLTRFAPREYDSDNLQSAFKYIRDAVSEYITGCKKAGMADSDKRFTWEYCQVKTTDAEHYITVEICQKQDAA